MVFRDFLMISMKSKGLTKSELARRSGVTVRSINYYLRDGRIPRLDVADKLLKALEVSLKIGKEGA